MEDFYYLMEDFLEVDESALTYCREWWRTLTRVFGIGIHTIKINVVLSGNSW